VPGFDVNARDFGGIGGLRHSHVEREIIHAISFAQRELGSKREMQDQRLGANERVNTRALYADAGSRHGGAKVVLAELSANRDAAERARLHLSSLSSAARLPPS